MEAQALVAMLLRNTGAAAVEVEVVIRIGRLGHNLEEVGA